MLAEALQQRIETIPVLRMLLEAIYRKRFSGNAWGAYYGVYESFKDANRAAPRTKLLGFNNAAYAQEFEDRLSRALSFDYPVMFWLGRLVEPGTQLFDYGGHRGTNFYAYSRYLKYPAGFKWIVCDLPEIVKAGEELARRKKRSEISFTTSFSEASGVQILLAAGSLQYIEAPPFAVSLAALSVPPRHLLLNKLPLYEGKQIVTLQNGGPAFHAQYVFNRNDFIDSICAVGYELIDRWDVPSHPGRIPFHPEASFRSHTGLYFRFRS
jgi:putative methyltransferase (TIGR04325 family)